MRVIALKHGRCRHTGHACVGRATAMAARNEMLISVSIAERPSEEAVIGTSAERATQSAGFLYYV